MRVLIFSDVQAREGNERLRTDPSVLLQIWRVESLYSLMAKLARKHACEAVWDLGDTVDDRDSISYRTLKAVSEGSAKICAGTLPVRNFKLIGNHEQHLKNTEIHAGHAFRPYFHVVDDRGVYVHVSERFTLICAAFPRDERELEAWMADAIARHQDEGRKIYVIGHFQLKGCQLSSGSSATGISREALKGADLVLLGHVHKPQAHGNVFYIGSPFQQDHGEAGEDKRVAILDTATGTVEWVKVDGFPRYKTISQPELLKLNDLGEDRIRVMLRSPDETKTFYEHPLAPQVDAVYAYTEQAKAVERETVKLLTDPQDMLRAYVAERPLEGFTTEEILSHGQEIIGKA